MDFWKGESLLTCTLWKPPPGQERGRGGGPELLLRLGKEERKSGRHATPMSTPQTLAAFALWEHPLLSTQEKARSLTACPGPKEEGGLGGGWVRCTAGVLSLP